MNAADVLQNMADTFRERGKVYKQNYTMIGEVLAVMFPDGITLKTADEHNRFHLFLMAMIKMTRQANAGIAHTDSAHDAGVYSAMLESLIAQPGIISGWDPGTETAPPEFPCYVCGGTNKHHHACSLREEEKDK